MPIVWPDNPNREERVIQLGTDIEDNLNEAMQYYSDFRKGLDQANERIAAAYEKSGLPPPTVSEVALTEKGDIESTVNTADTIAKMVDILVGVTGLALEVKFLAPAVVRVLVERGLMTPEKAAQVVFSFGTRVIGREIEVTIGDIAGNIIGGVLGGIAVVGIDIGIEAIEGAILHDKLVNAIHSLHPTRTAIRVMQLKARNLSQSVAAVNVSLDALDAAGALSKEVLDKVIVNSVQPAVAEAAAISATDVAAMLKSFDQNRKSFMDDDPA